MGFVGCGVEADVDVRLAPAARQAIELRDREVANDADPIGEVIHHNEYGSSTSATNCAASARDRKRFA